MATLDFSHASRHLATVCSPPEHVALMKRWRRISSTSCKGRIYVHDDVSATQRRRDDESRRGDSRRVEKISVAAFWRSGSTNLGRADCVCHRQETVGLCRAVVVFGRDGLAVSCADGFREGTPGEVWSGSCARKRRRGGVLRRQRQLGKESLGRRRVYVGSWIPRIRTRRSVNHRCH